MMSEEEKKAIDRLKYALIYDRESISSLMGFNDIKIVLQLVNKQQKEIEELEKNEFISKDKIRENIKELEGQEDWYIEHKSLDDLYGRIDELKQLLEE